MPFVSFSVLHITAGRRWPALQRFGMLRMELPKTKGLLFGKAMGCGMGAVFSIKPDWGRYALLGVWESTDAFAAFAAGRAYRALQAHTDNEKHLHLLLLTAKGKWDGRQPFEAIAGAPPPGMPLAVLTRAAIHPLKLRAFWKHSEAASAAIEQQHGLQYSLGMGELPFIRQATFSIWDDAESMKQYAYKNLAHIAAMRGKSAYGWFTEELFARFAVLREAGSAAALIVP